MKLFLKLIKQPSSWLLMLIVLILIGVISANNNFKVGTDGKMECTAATINVVDIADTQEQPNLEIESANYRNKQYSNCIEIENKNYDNSDFVLINSRNLVVLDNFRYGFDFAVDSTGKIYWIVKDRAGKLINVTDNQFNFYAPGEATNLMLNSNGAYINGYQIQTATSDEKLKTNIQDSEENALDKIIKIRHRSFKWKESGQEQKNGYIAQELQKIDGEFVIKNEDKYSINLLNLLATTTKAIQEQQEQIEDLKQEIKNLKAGD